MIKKQFYPLDVIAVDKTTSDCVLISLKIPPQWKEIFKFIPGQHLTVKQKINGKEIRRNYSICSLPSDDLCRIAVKHIENGVFSTFANHDLRPEDTLDCLPPSGKFQIHQGNSNKNNHVAFAAGSGITPILSMIQAALVREPEISFQLFFVNRTVSSIILKEEIESLKNRFMNRFEVYHFLTREERDIPLFNGRLDKDKLDKVFQHFISQDNTQGYYLCGPQAMVDMIREYLKHKNINEKEIHFELFHAELPTGKTTQIAKPEIKGNTCEITVTEGGKSFSFSYTPNGKSLLETALDHMANLPFACLGGVCCTCRAKLLDGEVTMNVNYALEKEEIEEGYILTCQAQPKTEKIVIDFDQ